MKLSYEEILDNPELLRRVLADARHERAQAVHDLLKKLFRRPAPPREVRYIAGKVA